MEERWFGKKYYPVGHLYDDFIIMTKASRMLVFLLLRKFGHKRFSVECAKALVLHNDAF